jgi:hypothetical protein
MKNLKQVGIPLAVIILTVMGVIFFITYISIILEALKYIIIILFFIGCSIAAIWFIVMSVTMILDIIASIVYGYFFHTNNIESSIQTWVIEFDSKTQESFLTYPGEKKIPYSAYSDMCEVSRQIPKTDLLIVKWLFVLGGYDKVVFKKPNFVYSYKIPGWDED